MNQSISVRYVDITENQADQRIDNFLLRELKGVPKSRIYRILRKGEVRINQGRVKPSYKLQIGDRVRIPPVRVPEPGEAPQGKSLEKILGCILFEDDRWLGLNKPAGMAVHGGSGLQFGVIEALRAARPNAPYLELVHRLDRGTSGCLLVAKRRSALRAAHEVMRKNNAEKRYLVLTQPGWQSGITKVNAALTTHSRHSGERHVQADPNGKTALSHFKKIQSFRSADLLEVRIVTGRTHQIRVHAAHKGHAVAGDNRYGDDRFNAEMAALGLRRLFLHASELNIQFPTDLNPVCLSAELPEELRSILNKLEASE